MDIIKNLVDSSKYSLKCPYEMNAEFIVTHNTYNDAPARNEIKYMISNNTSTSFHYAVDDKEVVQGIPEDRNAFHAGDGRNGQGNRKGLSIEICYSKSGGERFIQAEKNAAKFIAMKLKERGWGIDRVKKHQDFSNKYCPHRTLDMGWERFLNLIREELGQVTVEVKPEPVKQEENKKIGVDGKWGKETTTRAQEVFGTHVDGIVSNQYLAYRDKNKGLLSSTFEWEEVPGKNGSALIKAIQRWIGVKDDGFIGPNTIRAMQRKLGTYVDGYVSEKSNMVIAFQKWLNQQ